MKRLKSFFPVLLLVLFVMGISSCDDDRWRYEEYLVGYSWVGDIGEFGDHGHSLSSDFYFGKNGFGDEILFYTNNGQEYDRYQFTWGWESPECLYIDYGRVAGYTSFIKILALNRTRLEGIFYADEEAYDYEDGIRITLYKE
jgi:hypothetical protein